jgi:hypothetical protein
MGAVVGAASVHPITLTASQVRLHITGRDLSAGTPYVQLNLRTAREAFVDIQLERLRAGAHAYVASLPCRTGCLFRGITWDRPVTVDATMRGTATDRHRHRGRQDLAAPRRQPDRPGGWRAAAPQGKRPTSCMSRRPGSPTTSGHQRRIRRDHLRVFAEPDTRCRHPDSYVSTSTLEIEDLSVPTPRSPSSRARTSCRRSSTTAC